MKITLLTIKNFLKLKDIEIRPSKTNIIVGKNRQGKTSILKAIQAAFDGKLDEKNIRVVKIRLRLRLSWMTSPSAVQQRRRVHTSISLIRRA